MARTQEAKEMKRFTCFPFSTTDLKIILIKQGNRHIETRKTTNTISPFAERILYDLPPPPTSHLTGADPTVSSLRGLLDEHVVLALVLEAQLFLQERKLTLPCCWQVQSMGLLLLRLMVERSISLAPATRPKQSNTPPGYDF